MHTAGGVGRVENRSGKRAEDCLRAAWGVETLGSGRHAEARAFENARDQAGPSPLSNIGPSESQLLGPFWRFSLDW